MKVKGCLIMIMAIMPHLCSGAEFYSSGSPDIDRMRAEVKDSSGKVVKEGYYRTKELVLEVYDKMAEAIATGTEYKTILNPAPGPPCTTTGTPRGLPETSQ